jgi:hypothetical protein
MSWRSSYHASREGHLPILAPIFYAMNMELTQASNYEVLAMQ